MRRAVLWITGIVALTACLAAANLKRDPSLVEVDWQLFRPSPPNVAVDHPSRGPIARTIAAKGIVEPIHQVQVVAKVSGKVVEVLVEEGASVRKGDPLVRLEDAAFRTRLDSAKTRLDTATTNLGIAETHLRDIEKDPAAATTPATPNPASAPSPNLIAGFPAISNAPSPVGPTRLEAARNSVDGWKRERKSAEAAVDPARADLDRTVIRAAIDGVVEDLAVEVGDDVASSPTLSAGPQGPPVVPAGMMGFGIEPGANRPELAPGSVRPLCVILDPAQLRVRAWIDEADVSLVGGDQPARIFLPDEPAVPVAGRISKVAPRGRPSGEVVAFAATIGFNDARRRAKAGMRVNVEIEVSRKENPLGVPVQAVIHRKRRDLPGAVAQRLGGESVGSDGDSGYVKAVFVVDGTLVRLRPIATGLSDERRVEVVSGLSGTDRIVVGPFRALDILEDGMVVRAAIEPETSLNLTQGHPPEGRRPTR